MTLGLDALRSSTSSMARPLARLLAVGVWAWAAAAGAEQVDGVQLPDGAARVGERRYRSPKDFEDTLTYFRTVYPAATYPRRTVINQAGVKAVHISFPPGKSVEGINVYEDRETLREVRIYLVPTTTKAPQNAVDKRKGKK